VEQDRSSNALPHHPNWRGRPLVSHEVIVNLIANTATQHGLKIKAELDHPGYPTGTKVSAAELQDLNLKPHSFHGDWNYIISPTPEKNRFIRIQRAPS
jgi:Rhodopirellula transposase DDE domain